MGNLLTPSPPPRRSLLNYTVGSIRIFIHACQYVFPVKLNVMQYLYFGVILLIFLLYMAIIIDILN